MYDRAPVHIPGHCPPEPIDLDLDLEEDAPPPGYFERLTIAMATWKPAPPDDDVDIEPL